MSERFNKFETTSLYRDYAFVFEADKVITQEEEDFYENAKKELSVIFKCSYIPNDIEITAYIRREELDIDYKDLPEFFVFVKVIYERLSQKMFNWYKQKKINDKEATRQAKQDEKAKIRELKRQEKLELKIKEADKICRCDCGKQYTYSNRLKHLSTALHFERLEAIEYYKSTL